MNQPKSVSNLKLKTSYLHEKHLKYNREPPLLDQEVLESGKDRIEIGVLKADEDHPEPGGIRPEPARVCIPNVCLSIEPTAPHPIHHRTGLCEARSSPHEAVSG